jgi:hypothetical protein
MDKLKDDLEKKKELIRTKLNETTVSKMKQ